MFKNAIEITVNQFRFPHAFKPSQGPTQLPFQWVPGALSLRVKRQDHLYLLPSLRTRGAIPPLSQ